jgi:hypothetical protein
MGDKKYMKYNIIEKGLVTIIISLVLIYGFSPVTISYPVDYSENILTKGDVVDVDLVLYDVLYSPKITKSNEYISITFCIEDEMENYNNTEARLNVTFDYINLELSFVVNYSHQKMQTIQLLWPEGVTNTDVWFMIYPIEQNNTEWNEIDWPDNENVIRNMGKGMTGIVIGLISDLEDHGDEFQKFNSILLIIFPSKELIYTNEQFMIYRDFDGSLGTSYIIGFDMVGFY